MVLSQTIKKADAFKVLGTFIIPKEINKSGRSLYSSYFGSIPGSVFTLIALMLTLVYLIPQMYDMEHGTLDTYTTSNSDFFEPEI